VGALAQKIGLSYFIVVVHAESDSVITSKLVEKSIDRFRRGIGKIPELFLTT